MALNLRRVFGALAATVVLVALTITPAAAADLCALELSAAVDGSTTSGDLALSVTPSTDDWTYSVHVPRGYGLVSLDGEFSVSTIDGDMALAGGVVVRSSSISGDFSRVSACFVRSDRALPGSIPL